MNAIKATWIDGRIQINQSVDWPEGSELMVIPLAPRGAKIGIGEDEWRDDPAALADWDAWLKTIEPLDFTAEEQADLSRYEEEFRRHNLDAVRQQMLREGNA